MAFLLLLPSYSVAKEFKSDMSDDTPIRFYQKNNFHILGLLHGDYANMDINLNLDLSWFVLSNISISINASYESNKIIKVDAISNNVADLDDVFKGSNFRFNKSDYVSDLSFDYGAALKFFIPFDFFKNDAPYIKLGYNQMVLRQFDTSYKLKIGAGFVSAFGEEFGALIGFYCDYVYQYVSKEITNNRQIEYAGIGNKIIELDQGIFEFGFTFGVYL